MSGEIAQVVSLQGELRRINEALQDEGKPIMKPEGLLSDKSNPMFGEPEISPEVEQMFLAFHNSTQKQTTDMINKYRQKTQGDVFDTARQDKNQLIAEVFGNETKKSLFTRIMKAIRDNV